jgi:hypothetical protein
MSASTNQILFQLAEVAMHGSKWCPDTLSTLSNELLISGSIILSSVKDYEFVVYRRFNYVTCLYITNRYVNNHEAYLSYIVPEYKISGVDSLRTL